MLLYMFHSETLEGNILYATRKQSIDIIVVIDKAEVHEVRSGGLILYQDYQLSLG